MSVTRERDKTGLRQRRGLRKMFGSGSLWHLALGLDQRGRGAAGHDGGRSDQLDDLSHKAFPIAGETQPPQRIADFDLSIASHTVTLEQVVEANYRQYQIDDPQSDAMKWYFPHLRKSFSEQNSGINRSYFGRHSEAAAILTKEKELHVKISTDIVDDPELVGTLSKLSLLHLQAKQFLSDDDFRTCMDPVFSVITYCLQVADSVEHRSKSVETEDTEERSRLIKQLDFVRQMLLSEYARAEEAFYKVLQRNALVRYFYGMLVGMVIISSLSFWMTFLYHGEVFGLDHRTMGTAVVAGAIGAFISVITRISSGRFSLSRGTVALQQATRKAMMLWVLGALRPLIGAVFASAFVIFQSSRLLPIQPAGDVSEVTYYAGLAFVAGFSERWAQDMVVSTRTTLLEARPSVESSLASSQSGVQG
jgi:hypothetical protein